MDILGILLAALSAFLLGGVWYGPLFVKSWIKENNFTQDYLAKRNMGLVFGLSFVAFIISSFLLSMFIGVEMNLQLTLVASASTGFWTAASLAVIYLFEKRSLKLWLINGGYLFISFIIMGIVLYLV